MLNKKMDELKKAINQIDWEDLGIEKPEVNEELAYAIFGDDLDIEMTHDELVEMFLFEL